MHKYRHLITISAFLLYVGLALALYRYLGAGVTALGVIPVVAIGWAYGLRAGLLAGILSLPINTIVLALSAPLQMKDFYQLGLPGTLMLIIIGTAVGWMHDLQQQLRAEIKEHFRAESELRAIFNSSALGIFLTDHNGKVIESNAALSQMLGYSREDLIDNADLSVEHPDDAATPAHIAQRNEILTGTRQIYQREKRYIRQDGEVVLTRLTVSPVYDPQGGVQYMVGIIEDITKYRHAEDALRASEARLQAIIANAPVIIFALDQTGTATLVEGQGLALIQLNPAAIIGQSYEDVFAAHPELVEQFRQAIHGKPFTTTFHYADHVFEISCLTNKDDHGKPIGIIGVATDVTGREQYEAQLSYQAHHDALTNLPNRRLFNERLEHALADNEAYGSPAILFLDLDRFKVINDSLGHDIGDQLLRAVAARLLSCIRPQDMVARLSGDEFVILLGGVLHEQEATRVADRVIAATRRPFQIRGHEIVITTSIGIVIAPPDKQHLNAAELIQHADMAMYRAKRSGKSRYAVYDQTMSHHAFSRLELENELRRGIELNEFQLVYQPQVDLSNGKLVGVEALIRWQHPTRGLLTPNTFVPLAEETGLIIPLGRWILATACRQMREWHHWQAEFAPDTPLLNLCVNLSVRQFQDPNLLLDVAYTLAETQFPPHYLHLEITESIVMEEEQAARDTLQRLQELGVKLAIDDFGTGYSNLSYLKRFPAEMLKIDQRFTAGLDNGSPDEAIVSAILLIGHGLKLQICAEGVETGEQVAHLRALGCTYGQGYYFSPPRTPSELRALLETPNDSTWQNSLASVGE